MRPVSPTGGGPGNLTASVRAGISGFVLAGGRSSRLGQDKTLLPWPPLGSGEGNNGTLLDHAIARLKRVCSKVSICADRDDLPRTEAVIPDAIPGSGPLGGIVAALEHSTTDWNFLLAVDLPCLPVEVLQALAVRLYSVEDNVASSRASCSDQFACILPQLEGLPQPLCGLYHRALAPELRRALVAGKFKVMAALGDAVRNLAPGPEVQMEIPARRIELWDAASFAATMGPSPNPSEWFLNINTPEDWQQAQQLRVE
ncbi:MAG: molybdenum cofactor guanylyltransferase [Acidobacteriaceae bacterium]